MLPGQRSEVQQTQTNTHTHTHGLWQLFQKTRGPGEASPPCHVKTVARTLKHRNSHNDTKCRGGLYIVRMIIIIIIIIIIICCNIYIIYIYIVKKEREVAAALKITQG